MSRDEIAARVAALPGVVTVTASEATGAPEVSWGDTFFFHDPDGDDPTARRMPFATIVIHDYPGFDTASDLNRPGVFRLNIGVGRAVFERLFGCPPSAHATRQDDIDHTALDRLVPHPVYAAQAWVAVLNPGESTAARAWSLLVEAHDRAARRHRPRA